jgi:hypothetical protein
MFFLSNPNGIRGTKPLARIAPSADGTEEAGIDRNRTCVTNAVKHFHRARLTRLHTMRENLLTIHAGPPTRKIDTGFHNL